MRIDFDIPVHNIETIKAEVAGTNKIAALANIGPLTLTFGKILSDQGDPRIKVTLTGDSPGWPDQPKIDAFWPEGT